MLPAVTAIRYVTPLREGGSLPGLMEADDLGTYVVEWRAAGQGGEVLVAETPRPTGCCGCSCCRCQTGDRRVEGLSAGMTARVCP
ncbi:hypothetical protein [Geodermatophilus sp. DF01-2]|uniref:hypothetical protein n=1 Tax=Geodermatophilus sp. DF01-2 TaxID=2559610 RepID=UPI001FD73595|nr:hypothetical protein [Geodermatophilus sp. DF01_2]